MPRRMEPASTTPRHGGNGPDQRPPEVVFSFDSWRPGHPLAAEIRAHGHEWFVLVDAAYGHPEVRQSVGGDSPNERPLPPELLRPLWVELKRLYENGEPHEQIAIRLAGFPDGVRRPTLPRRQADTLENLAVRTRRVHDDRRAGKKAVNATELDAIKRAGKENLYAHEEHAVC
jgi:hypothetical protein